MRIWRPTGADHYANHHYLRADNLAKWHRAVVGHNVALEPLEALYA